MQLSVIVIVGALIWLFWPEAQDTQAPMLQGENVSATGSTPASSESNSVPSQSDSTVTYFPPGSFDPAAENYRRREQAIERSLDEFQTPIEFYGKVVDESGQPVEGAVVSFSCNDTSATGTSYYQTVSDAQGLFSIAGIRGKLLALELSKPGYYTSQRDTRHFYYAGQNVNFVPNRSQPVLFHLRKHGQAEPLIVWNATQMISVSGRPLHLDRQTGSVVPEGTGHLIMEYKKGSVNPLFGKRYDWSFKISVSGGGLLLSTAEFDFLAPDTGYQPADEIVMAAGDENWEGRMNRSYFVKFADGIYGRIMLDLMPHNGSLRISALLNPTDSRNLEYSEAAQTELTTP